MNKIGENKDAPKVQSKALTKKGLEESIFKFEKALRGYMADEGRTHCKAVMDEEIGLIKQAASEFSLRGMHKQEVKVETDYKNFLSTGSDESYAALVHDLQTLRDFNQFT